MSADLSRWSRRRCGVVGSPISHSLSPVLHQAAYRALGLNWSYEAIEVSEGQLESFVLGLDHSWRGLSVTMPLKREAFKAIDGTDDDFAEELRIVNTIVLTDDERRESLGYNTDIDGVRGALRGAGVDVVGDLIVVGGGATAESALAAVRQLGAQNATILVREPERAQLAAETAYRHGLEATVVRLDEIEKVPPAAVLISTIPAAAQAPYAATLVDRAEVVFDVVYDPARTPLIEAAEKAGRSTIGGIEMLVHQAARQLELMTACRTAPIDAMRAAGLAALGNR
jgi:shikimate dehydrogenase